MSVIVVMTILIPIPIQFKEQRSNYFHDELISIHYFDLKH